MLVIKIVYNLIINQKILEDIMKLFKTLLVIVICFSLFNCAGKTESTLGPINVKEVKSVAKDSVQKTKTVQEFVSSKTLSHKTNNWTLFGSPTSAIDLAIAEAIRKDAENQANREAAETALLKAYTNNPKKYSGSKALEKTGFIQNQVPRYKILVYNNTGRTIKVAISGRTEEKIIHDSGRSSFSTNNRHYTIYSYEMNGEPLKPLHDRIKKTTADIPYSNKLYHAMVKLNSKHKK